MREYVCTCVRACVRAYITWDSCGVLCALLLLCVCVCVCASLKQNRSGGVLTLLATLTFPYCA